MRRLPIQQDKAGLLCFQDTVLIIFTHLFLDLLDDFLISFRIAQVDLWEDEIQGGGCIFHKVLDRFPVLRLRGVLITGDDTPFGEVQALSGQQNSGNFQTEIWEVRRCLRCLAIGASGAIGPPGATLT